MDVRRWWSWVVICAASVSACDESLASPDAGPSRSAGPSPDAPRERGEARGEAGVSDAPLVALDDLKDQYAWLEGAKEAPPLVRLEDRFPAPAGFARVEAKPGSFALWLRGLPLEQDRVQVRSYKGDPIQASAAAVLHWDVGEVDAQQCADSILRLWAEYLWQAGRADEAAFHFTSGDETSWTGWRKGERFSVQGAKVKKSVGQARANTHEEFRRWLDLVFRYAGTRSLPTDSAALSPKAPLQPGDFFVQPGGPGHAVIVLDVATHPDGRRVGLVGQGFMPAQDFHVLKGSSPEAVEGVWFVLPDDAAGVLDVPSWRPFARDEARRFSE